MLIIFEQLKTYHLALKDFLNQWITGVTIPATNIVQDNLNSFATKDEKISWNNKLDADANAVSASKFYKPVNINGIPFDGSKDIIIPSSSVNNYDIKNITTTLNPNEKSIIVPSENLSNFKTIFVYIDGIKQLKDKHFKVNLLNNSIDLIQPYSSSVDVEITFISTQNKELVYELAKGVKEIKLLNDINLNVDSVIQVFVDGVKLIKDKHFSIDLISKTITLTNSYSTNVEVEVIILK